MAHYSTAHDPGHLIPWSMNIAESIHHEIESDDIFVSLIYSGMSGIALATSIQNAYYQQYSKNLHLTYIRKDNEKSHGRRAEFIMPSKMDLGKTIMLVFVDDFIESGSTLIHCLDVWGKFVVPDIKSHYHYFGSVRIEVKNVLLALERRERLKKVDEIFDRRGYSSKEDTHRKIQEAIDKVTNNSVDILNR